MHYNRGYNLVIRKDITRHSKPQSYNMTGCVKEGLLYALTFHIGPSLSNMLALIMMESYRECLCGWP